MIRTCPVDLDPASLYSGIYVQYSLTHLRSGGYRAVPVGFFKDTGIEKEAPSAGKAGRDVVEAVRSFLGDALKRNIVWAPVPVPIIPKRAGGPFEGGFSVEIRSERLF